MITFGDTLAGIDYHNHREQLKDTWGHLAPVKNRTYRGRIIYAMGCYDSGELNPTPLLCELGDLSSSPWFYEAIHKWLQNLPEDHRGEGKVMEWSGTFRNYKLNGVIRQLLDANVKALPPGEGGVDG